jgi:carboxyl-terminal processing protease
MRPGILILLLLASGTSDITAAEPTNETPRVLTPSRSAFDTLSRFSSILEALQKNYVRPSAIYDAARATAALREYVHAIDPDADLLTPDEAAAANAPLPEGTGDLGLALTIRNDLPTIVAPRDGSAAQRAGLLAGECITAIDGQSTSHARLREIYERLRGPIGTKTTLTVLDPVTDERRDLRLERIAAPPPQITETTFLGAGILYCRVGEFSVPVVERLRTEVGKAKVQRASGLILDLRNNPGGTFNAAQAAASLFLPARADIVALDYANPAFRTTFVSDDSEKYTPRIILLVNRGTAAEAEIFAGALRDQKRARLVGSATAGQGRMSTLFPLSDGSALFVPTAYYLPPSKQPFHNTGLTPDVVVDLPRTVERQLATAGFGSFNWYEDKRAVQETDLQLARAFQLLTK